MQTWEKQLDALSTAQCSDLYNYLWKDDSAKIYLEEEIKQHILKGKKRHLFKIIDKDAFKTMRRLYRHQERAIDTSIYPIEQLLKVGIAREVRKKDDRLQYALHPQALPFVKSILHARHFDEYLKSWQIRDYLLMGIMHTYGMLEIEQLCALLKTFDIDVEAQEIIQSSKWRLSIRDQLQICEIQTGKQMVTYIALKHCDFDKLIKTRKQKRELPEKIYTYEDFIYRKERYYALENTEIKTFMNELKTRFSHQFAESSAKELIDLYQYQYGSFTHYNSIIRVLNEKKINMLIEVAIASFDTI